MIDKQKFISAINGLVDYMIESDHIRLACINPDCPCGDPTSHMHLYVYFKEEEYQNAGWCFRCDSSFTLEYIISRITGRSVDQVKRHALGTNYLEMIKTCSDRIKSLTEKKSKISIITNDEGNVIPISLPYEFIPLVGNDNIPYLSEDRKLDQPLVEYLGIGWCKDGYFANRVIIPTVDMDTIVGFSARAVYGPPKGLSFMAKKRWIKENKYRKTLFPKHFKAAHYVHMLNLTEGRSVVVSEGPFDAISIFKHFRNGTCIFGKHIKPQQVLKIKKFNPSEVFVLFDHGAESEADSAVRDLRDVGLKAYRCVCAPSKDPGEMTKEEIAYSLCNPVNYKLI